MSDFKPAIMVNFINRRTSAVITTMPRVNRISINSDLRQFTDTFDFDISYRFSESIDIRSHDFVEFYFYAGKQKVQIFCGFVEDFVHETSSGTHTFQGNGRDFLGQLFNLPFLTANPGAQMTLLSFAKSCVSDAYLPQYQSFRGLQQAVVNQGVYPGVMLIPQLSNAKRAPVLQSMADEVFNVIYQDQFGRMIVWGRDNLTTNDTGITIRETGDINCNRMAIRQNHSKVFSLVKVNYTGGTGGIDFANTPSTWAYNSEPEAQQIVQPEIRDFQTSTLITTAPGSVEFNSKINQYAASILRKSNQNLISVVVHTNRPFYVDSKGNKTVYAKNQLWTISAPTYGINRKMRLVGVGYVQDAQSLEVQLLFIPYDSLI